MILLIVPIGIFDVILFLLALRMYLKEISHIRELKQHWNMQSLFSVALRDSILYFVVYVISLRLLFCSKLLLFYFCSSLAMNLTWALLVHFDPVSYSLPHFTTLADLNRQINTDLRETTFRLLRRCYLHNWFPTDPESSAYILQNTVSRVGLGGCGSDP
jgi:hypothetical protein